MTLDLNENDKLRKIHAIEKEVSELHPILKGLLPRLPRVKSVDYTHGNTERGADFLMKVDDDTVGEEIWVGVIAKVGKINRNLNDQGIVDQIESCKIERHSVDGRKKIQINAIYIITTNTISDQAREFIFEKYRGTSIQFWDSGRLIERINRYYKSYWEEIPVEISKFIDEFSKLAESVEDRLNVASGGISLQKIELDFDEIAFKYGEKTSKSIDLIKCITENKVIIIDAPPGFGKTTTLVEIGRSLTSPANYAKHKHIPFYLHASELFCKKIDGIAALINKSIKHDEWAEGNISSAVLLIDGLDECTDGGRKHLSEILSTIDEIQKIPYIKLVIASRPLEITEEFPSTREKYKWITIRQISRQKLVKYFKSVIREARLISRIQRDVEESDLFDQIPRSPITITLMAALINSTDKELPSNLTELYSKFTELMLGRWEIEKGLLNTTEFEASIAICCDMAEYYFENNLSYISIDEALGYFDKYLSSRNLSIDALELFDKVSKRSGILIQDSEKNRVGFRHRTFIEYIYALGQYRKGKRISIDSELFNPSKHVVNFFKFGLQKDAEHEIESAANMALDDDFLRFTKFHYLPKYCLAAYLTPYKSVKKSLEIALLDAARLYQQTNSGEIKNPLQEYPSIPLLYTFQYSIRSVYSYDYFKKAILEIESDVVNGTKIANKDEKASMLFFIAVIKADLKIEKPFDYLIKAFSGSDIPFIVGIGIHYEAKRLKDVSTLLNRSEKKLKKIIQGSGSGMNDYIKNLHEVPIKDKIGKNGV